ncbi:MAG: lasso peptide biosynthesis PqqD family chaperone [Candidatus Riflebacteria bacterium]|nr:lasso peptide biosynthesis PqqD family chaperone [Candidatus Riflebacteria bacterium]
MKLTVKTKIVRSEELCFAKIGDELVLMSVDQGKYYNFDNIGSAIWDRIEKPVAIDDLCRELVKEFKVTQERCETDVLGYLEVLHAKKIISVVQ